MDDPGASIAHAAADADLARREIQQVERYLTRGRPYQNLPEPELASLWTQAVREWARVIYPRPQAGQDTEAEFSLRGIVPPWELVPAEAKRLRDAAAASLLIMTDDEKHAIGSDMIETYLAEMDALQ